VDAADPNATAELIAGFDQEAAAVLMARLVSFKMENEVCGREVHCVPVRCHMCVKRLCMQRERNAECNLNRDIGRLSADVVEGKTLSISSLG
jgi:hypothetical protein